MGVFLINMLERCTSVFGDVDQEKNVKGQLCYRRFSCTREGKREIDQRWINVNRHIEKKQDSDVKHSWTSFPKKEDGMSPNFTVIMRLMVCLHLKHIC